MVGCIICNHDKRELIEAQVMSVGTPGVSITLDQIAEEFNVKLVDLQVHAVMHPSKRQSELRESSSISGDLKRAEASLLFDMVEEYNKTLVLTGRHLRAKMSPSNLDHLVNMNSISKELVDLYLGAGNNLRQTVGTIVDMNQKLSSEADPALAAFKNLVSTLRGDPEEDDVDGLP